MKQRNAFLIDIITEWGLEQTAGNLWIIVWNSNLYTRKANRIRRMCFSSDRLRISKKILSDNLQTLLLTFTHRSLSLHPFLLIPFLLLISLSSPRLIPSGLPPATVQAACYPQRSLRWHWSGLRGSSRLQQRERMRQSHPVLARIPNSVKGKWCLPSPGKDCDSVNIQVRWRRARGLGPLWAIGRTLSSRAVWD